MIYSARNTSRAKVYDVDTQQELRHVMNIDTDTGEIEVTLMPLQLMADGDTIATEKIRFRSIHAIRGKEWAPCLFHCYGRKRTMAEVVAPLVAFMTGQTS